MPIHHRVAVLIDAENVSGDFAASVLREAGAYGTTVTRRAYADFVKGRGASWLQTAARYAVDTIQVSSPSQTKNFSDMRMAIDAVELMFGNKADVFCLVSSDSDFAPLAIHLRGAGKVVVGIGGQQASALFRQSCDAFHIVGQPSVVPAPVAAAPKPQIKPAGKPPKLQGLLPLVSAAIKTLGANTDSGWVSIGRLGKALRVVAPNFTTKSYGSANLTKLLLQEPSLDSQQREKGMFVRVKPGIAVISM